MGQKREIATKKSKISVVSPLHIWGKIGVKLSKLYTRFKSFMYSNCPFVILSAGYVFLVDNAIYLPKEISFLNFFWVIFNRDFHDEKHLNLFLTLEIYLLAFIFPLI